MADDNFDYSGWPSRSRVARQREKDNARKSKTKDALAKRSTKRQAKVVSRRRARKARPGYCF